MQAGAAAAVRALFGDMQAGLVAQQLSPALSLDASLSLSLSFSRSLNFSTDSSPTRKLNTEAAAGQAWGGAAGTHAAARQLVSVSMREYSDAFVHVSLRAAHSVNGGIPSAISERDGRAAVRTLVRVNMHVADTRVCVGLHLQVGMNAGVSVATISRSV